MDWSILFVISLIVIAGYSWAQANRTESEIDKAMRLWQLDKAQPTETAVTFAEISGYLGEDASTNCPSGGQYIVTGLTNPPACTIPGHALANEGGD